MKKGFLVGRLARWIREDARTRAEFLRFIESGRR